MFAGPESRLSIMRARFFLAEALLLTSALLAASTPPAHALESVLAFTDPTEAASGNTAILARFHYFTGNDSLAMREYQGNMQGNYHPREGRNIGLLSERAEISGQAGGWRVGVFQRREALIGSGRETTDLLRLYKSHSPATPGQSFVVDMDFQAYDATGWRINKAWRWNLADREATIGIGYSRLEGRRVRAGTATGSMTSLSAGNYGYAISFDDADTRKTYPFQTPGLPEGQGEAWDMGLSLKDASGQRLYLIANDLGARIRWRDIPSTLATANTGVTSTDADGYIVYAPALSGRNFRRDFTQNLPHRWVAGAEVPWQNFTLLGALSRQENINFPMVGVAWAFAEKWRLQGDYDLRFGSIGLKLTSPITYLALRTSKANLAEASAYGISAGLHWMF